VKFNLINIFGADSVFTTSDSTEECAGQFFGQSSFSNLAIVKESSIVDVSEIVHDEEELKLFSPMGCGFQTGAGTVTRLANATATDTVVIMGLGGVGLSSVMASLFIYSKIEAKGLKAAKIQGCRAIIGVDRVTSRLDLAKELGATHVIDTSDPNFDLVAKVQELTNQAGANIIIDTTGVVSLIRNAWDFTANKGHLIIIGIPPPDGVLEIKLGPFLSVRFSSHIQTPDMLANLGGRLEKP